MSRLGAAARLAVWSTFLVVTLRLLHGSTMGALSIPLDSFSSLEAWADRTSPAAMALGLVRLVALAATWYLVAVTALTVVADVAGWRRLAAVAAAASPGLVRRLATRGAGAGLAAGALLGIAPLPTPLDHRPTGMPPVSLAVTPAGATTAPADGTPSVDAPMTPSAGLATAPAVTGGTTTTSPAAGQTTARAAADPTPRIRAAIGQAAMAPEVARGRPGLLSATSDGPARRPWPAALRGSMAMRRASIGPDGNRAAGRPPWTATGPSAPTSTTAPPDGPERQGDTPTATGDRTATMRRLPRAEGADEPGRSPTVTAPSEPPMSDPPPNPTDAEAATRTDGSRTSAGGPSSIPGNGEAGIDTGGSGTPTGTRPQSGGAAQPEAVGPGVATTAPPAPTDPAGGGAPPRGDDGAGPDPDPTTPGQTAPAPTTGRPATEPPTTEWPTTEWPTGHAPDRPNPGQEAPGDDRQPTPDPPGPPTGRSDGPRPTATMTRLPPQASELPAPPEGTGTDIDLAAATASAQAATQAEPGGDEWVVEFGDSFWSIAEETLADASPGRRPDEAAVTLYWQLLVSANRDRLADPANPDLLLPGQALLVPPP